MNCAQQLPSRRTSAPCDTETQTSNLDLRGFLQLNNRQMPVAGELACPRAVVRASRARAMAWTVAERTIWGQFLGSGRRGVVCRAMKVLSKDLGVLSSQVEDNARKQLDLPDTGTY